MKGSKTEAGRPVATNTCNAAGNHRGLILCAKTDVKFSLLINDWSFLLVDWTIGKECGLNVSSRLLGEEHCVGRLIISRISMNKWYQETFQGKLVTTFSSQRTSLPHYPKASFRWRWSTNQLSKVSIELNFFHSWLYYLMTKVYLSITQYLYARMLQNSAAPIHTVAGQCKLYNTFPERL